MAATLTILLNQKFSAAIDFLYDFKIFYSVIDVILLIVLCPNSLTIIKHRALLSPVEKMKQEKKKEKEQEGKNDIALCS